MRKYNKKIVRFYNTHDKIYYKKAVSYQLSVFSIF